MGGEDKKEGLDMAQDPTYCLEITDDGVFLTVYSLPEAYSTQMPLIMQEIAARNLENVDWKEVERANLKRSKKLKIAPPQMASKNDGVLLIDISDDQMGAYATLFPPLNDGSPVTKDTVMEKLSSAGVNYGIVQEKVQELVTLQKHARSWTIARGQQVKRGRDAAIEYSFNISKDLSKPQILDSGRVDFYNLNMIQSVVEGQELAKKTPAVPGVSGITVTGKPINPPIPRDVLLKPGKNAMLANDGLTLIAKISGHAFIQAGCICVSPVFEVAGDVDLSTGNIDFIGGVRILGNIRPGFTVNAGGDVEVNRTVEGGFIRAGGNIIVKEGILGRERGQITADGSVYARFLENANVEAGHAVIVGDAIMNSIVKAGSKITVKGQKGKIIGGLCFAGEEIEAKVIGSMLAVNTELEIGISSQSIADLKALSKDEIMITDQLQKLEEMIKILNNSKELEKYLVLKGQDPDVLTATQQNLLTKLEAIKGKRSEILASFKLLEQGRVRVHECIHPGAVIRFANLSYNVREEMRHIYFYKEEDEVKAAPY